MLLLCPPLTPVPASGAPWDWVQLGPDAHGVPRHGRSAIGDWPPNEPALLCLPPGWVSWHRVRLPKVSGAKLRTALLGLLEDRTLQDIEQLHLALPPRFRVGQPAETWVALCQRDTLQAGLDALRAAGQAVHGLLPALVPQDAPTAWLHGRPSGPGWLGLAGPEGVVHVPLTPDHGAPDAATLRAWVSAFAGPTPLNGHTAEAWRPWAETHLPGHHWTPQPPWAPWLHSLRLGWQLPALDAGTANRPVAGAAPRWTAWWHRPAWRPVRWGVVGLCLVHLLGLNAAAWQARAAVRQLERDSRALVTATFPHVAVVLDAPLQMQREVALLRLRGGAYGGHDLAPVLSALGATGTPPVGLDQLTYTGDELVLRHPPLAQDGHAPWVSALRPLGWTLSATSETAATFTRTARP